MVEHWSRKPGVVGSIPIRGNFLSHFFLAFRIENIPSYRRYRILRSPVCINSPKPGNLFTARVGHTFLVARGCSRLPDIRTAYRAANRRFHVLLSLSARRTEGFVERRETRRPSYFWRKKVTFTLELKPQRHQHVSPIHQYRRRDGIIIS